MTTQNIELIETYASRANGNFDIYRESDGMETAQDVKERGGDKWQMPREKFVYFAVPTGKKIDRAIAVGGKKIVSKDIRGIRLYCEAE